LLEFSTSFVRFSYWTLALDVDLHLQTKLPSTCYVSQNSVFNIFTASSNTFSFEMIVFGLRQLELISTLWTHTYRLLRTLAIKVGIYSISLSVSHWI